MTRKPGFDAVAVPRRTAKTAVVAAAALLAACSTYEKLPSQTYDDDYKVFSVISDRSGQHNVFMLKAFEVDGTVALCGGYTLGASSLDKMGTRKWADTSKVYLGGKMIGSGEFMNEMPVYGFRQGEDPKELFLRLNKAQPRLNCVRSDVPWEAEFSDMDFERKGPTRLRVSD